MWSPFAKDNETGQPEWFARIASGTLPELPWLARGREGDWIVRAGRPLVELAGCLADRRNGPSGRSGHRTVVTTKGLEIAFESSDRSR